MRPVENELERRIRPWTSYPLSSSSSARYEPSWPVIPVISARLGSLNGRPSAIGRSATTCLAGLIAGQIGDGQYRIAGGGKG